MTTSTADHPFVAMGGSATVLPSSRSRFFFKICTCMLKAGAKLRLAHANEEFSRSLASRKRATGKGRAPPMLQMRVIMMMVVMMKLVMRMLVQMLLRLV